MSKRVKELVVEEIKKRLGSCTEMLVVDSSRLDAVTTNRFRLALREKNIRMTVKNSLARQALHGLGVTALDPVLEGPSSLVWGGEDIVSLSKEITKWAKELETLQIKGGAVEGTTLGPEDVEALSKSPGRVELIGRVIMLALSPGGRLVGAMLGPGGTVAGQVKSRAEEDGDAASE
ncbi:MAG: 50S ribosomal protein L10 [Planctomycetes bacterium]|nr:50S ribosomal protein L10 [Planctomycetota bacterium]